MALDIRYHIGDKFQTEQEYSILSSNDPEILGSSKPSGEVSTQGDNLRFGVPKEIRYFERNQTFIDPPSPESDIAWNKLLPDGRGYIYVENGAKYGLQPGVQKESGEIYSVSMFHQIHGLGVIRRDYYKLAMGIQTDDPTAVKEEAERQLAYEHTGHCFDYLRQAFECSADMTLEWPRTEKDGRRFKTEGMVFLTFVRARTQ
ncbi:hypothetical protein PISL3812_07889 [Talaromyces islandicus]|uniref:Uncharacterized protein n=1 Tax=Talaromyces islandicus TaxID=28573 RepID=A0A0U1M5I9_TALIS|nr:hypothetical protein PISL3812_07889 [Talaromyces islandicus]